jgi:hypothetical protein
VVDEPASPSLRTSAVRQFFSPVAAGRDSNHSTSNSAAADVPWMEAARALWVEPESVSAI